jgi:hypothetical protein
LPFYLPNYDDDQASEIKKLQEYAELIIRIALETQSKLNG